MTFQLTKIGHKGAKGSGMKRDMTFLRKCGDIYYLDFRMPKKWGGQRIRQSIGTSDYVTAIRVRDLYVRPVLVMDSAGDALRKIAAQIAAFDHEARTAVSTDELSRIISSETTGGVSWGDASEKYCKWLDDYSTLRPKTKEKYKMLARYFAQKFGADSPVCVVTKDKCAAIRDAMVEDGTSPTTIFNYFICIKGFVKWLGEQGIADQGALTESFKIELPTVRKKSTQCIPHDSADAAMNCLAEWTALPAILRYTGMRLNEALSCVRKEGGCGIVEKEGVQCFFVSGETCKTHIDRFIPVCNALKELMARPGFLDEAAATTTAITKKYNRAIKHIPGCDQAHIHSWRVYANTEMMEAGIDENLRRRILGHTSKDSHFVYSAARMAAMIAALDKIG